MVNYRTPRTGNLVQVEAHHKLIASVWVQIWNHGTRCGSVETKFLHYGHFQDSFSSFVCIVAELGDSMSLVFSLHFEVADSRGAVGAHGCTPDGVANRLSG